MKEEGEREAVEEFDKWLFKCQFPSLLIWQMQMKSGEGKRGKVEEVKNEKKTGN